MFFSGHKLYGPSGVGVLYMKNQWLNNFDPYQGGGDMIENVDLKKQLLPLVIKNMKQVRHRLLK